MADYNTIKDTVSKFLRQVSGDTATTLIPEFIDLAERSVYRRLRIPPMENITDLSTDATDGFITLPSDFLELKSLVLIDAANGNTEMKGRPYGEIEASTRSGTPIYYARKDNQIIFDPGPDAVKTMRMYYYREFSSLTSASPDNFISNSAPDVLIYGALVEAAPYLVAELGQENTTIMLRMWKKQFEEAIKELEFQTSREWEGTRLAEQ